MASVQVSALLSLPPSPNPTRLIDLPEWGWVSLFGADAAAFLQAQTCNDVLALAVGQGQYNAILDRKAQVLAWFTLHRTSDDSFWLVCEKSQIPALLERLEAVHFTEDVTWMTTDAQQWTSLHGPYCLPLLCQLGATTTAPLHEPLSFGAITWQDTRFQAIHRPLSEAPGIWLTASSDALAALRSALNTAVAAPPDALDASRIQAGLLAWGADITADTMLANVGADFLAYSPTKGCFPGQEILSKIHTKGSAPKSLVGVVGPSHRDLAMAPGPIQHQGQTIGQLTSSVWSPEREAWVGLAMVNRDWSRQVLSTPVPLADLGWVLHSLPMTTLQTPTALAQGWYHQALDGYAADASVVASAQAIEHLRNTLVWQPEHTDALEMLGVMLSRQNTSEALAEAIGLMQRLASLDPTAVMPHTNLSVFYMQQGDKDAAEQAKAKATVLAFQNAARQQHAQQAQAESARQRQADLESKVAMFREVLDLDPDDPLAHYGLGCALMDLDRVDDALPLLARSVVLQPTHTPSHLAYSQALVKANQPAQDAIAAGIALARQKGDLMPLKALEQLQQAQQPVNQAV
jgi:folate-binding protein YgfZ